MPEARNAIQLVDETTAVIDARPFHHGNLPGKGKLVLFDLVKIFGASRELLEPRPGADTNRGALGVLHFPYSQAMPRRLVSMRLRAPLPSSAAMTDLAPAKARGPPAPLSARGATPAEPLSPR